MREQEEKLAKLKLDHNLSRARELHRGLIGPCAGIDNLAATEALDPRSLNQSTTTTTTTTATAAATAATATAMLLLLMNLDLWPKAAQKHMLQARVRLQAQTLPTHAAVHESRV